MDLGQQLIKKIASETTDNIYDKATVKTKTLNEVINESSYKDTQIDVLSIDVEGMDFRVLRSLDIKNIVQKLLLLKTTTKKLKIFWKQKPISF